MNWIRLACVTVLVPGLAFTALTAAEAPLVITSTTILRDAVRQVGDDDVRIVSLLPAGLDPYDYEPNAEAIQLVSSARLIVVNGVDQEPWLPALIEASGYNAEVIVAAEGLTLLDSEGRLHDPEEADPDFEPALSQAVMDPHFWHDPRNMMHVVRQISYSLPDLLPDQGTEIEARTRSYVSALEELHGYAQREFGSIPRERRALATSHDSLGYLARAYDFEIVLIPDFEPGRTPQPPQMARMAEVINQLGLPAVFLRAGTSANALRQLSAETGVQIVTSLFTETLDGDATYVTRFRHNVEVITGALR